MGDAWRRYGAGMCRMDFGAAATEAVFDGRLQPSTGRPCTILVVCASRSVWYGQLWPVLAWHCSNRENIHAHAHAHGTRTCTFAMHMHRHRHIVHV